MRGLILAPVAWGNNLPTAVQMVASCGHPCFISRSGVVAVLLDRDLKTICAACVEPAKATRYGMIPGAVDELAATVGKEMAAAVAAMVQRLDRQTRARQN